MASKKKKKNSSHRIAPQVIYRLNLIIDKSEFQFPRAILRMQRTRGWRWTVL